MKALERLFIHSFNLTPNHQWNTTSWRFTNLMSLGRAIVRINAKGRSEFSSLVHIVRKLKSRLRRHQLVASRLHPRPQWRNVVTVIHIQPRSKEVELTNERCVSWLQLIKTITFTTPHECSSQQFSSRPADEIAKVTLRRMYRELWTANHVEAML